MVRLRTDEQIGPRSTSGGLQEQYANIPSVNSLQPEQQSDQCDCCCLIVAAFKKTFGFVANNATDLLALCGYVAMLALNAWLIG